MTTTTEVKTFRCIVLTFLFVLRDKSKFELIELAATVDPKKTLTFNILEIFEENFSAEEKLMKDHKL